MNWWPRKIASIFTVLFLALSLFSCEEGCVDADEFDVHSIQIESNPIEDGIYGYYDGTTGGQRANWHETGLRANGDMFLMQISGAWVALLGAETTTIEIEKMDRCNFCAKSYNGNSPNCICYKDQQPTPENDIGGMPRVVDCTDPANQDNASFCSCTKQHGEATDYGIYHFPLNIMDKDENILIPDLQTNCRYDRGMGAYIALWGSRGVTTPIRSYHLFTEEAVCNVARNSNGQCLDSHGNDVTRYVFRSADNRIFMKNDNDGNETIDSDNTDDTYHSANEYVKTIMYDRYYSDNQGRYNIKIFRGVGSEQEPGLLEFLVLLVEEVLLGEIGEDGERKGGLIEFMYKSIVQDSGFALVVQMSLTLYITLFGLAHLFGVVEISNRKEILNRVLKISLIIFFISEGSWYFYEKIVVSFFKDSMDYVVAMMMDLQDAKFDATTMVKIAQMDRAADVSNATRFSYVDLIIRNLMSAATTKKIFGLFLNSIFGIIYIPIIYALIFFFLYVMLYVASLYIANLVKLIFVLCLGPIFMVFSLFSRTQQMFKNWLGFLGGRSMEMIVLFTILYLFLNLIDKAFTDLLFYKTCAVNKGIGPAKFIVLIAEVDRNFIEWMMKFLGVGALIFITNLVIQKVPDVVSSIVSIGGVGAGSGGAAGMAGGLMGGMVELGKMAGGGLASAAGTAGRYGIRGATLAARKTGVTAAWDATFGKLPFNSPRTFYRHTIIDGAIQKARSQAGSLRGAERDKFIRENTVKSLQLLMQSDPNRMAFAGVDMKNISSRLDQKLLQDPLKKFMADEAKRMKYAGAANMKFGKEAQDQLKKTASAWAESNLYQGAGARVDQLFRDNKDFNNLAKSKTELSSSRAAKIFAGDKEGKDRYLQYLTDKDAKNKAEQEKAAKRWFTKLPNALGRGYHKLARDKENPKQMQKAFLRKAWQRENDKSWYQRFRFNNRDLVNQNKLDSQKSLLLDNIASGHNAAYARDRLAHLYSKELNGDHASLVKKRNDLTDSFNSLGAKDLMAAMTRKANINEFFNHKEEKDRDYNGQLDRLASNYIEERLKAAERMASLDKMKEMERLSEFALLNANVHQGNIDNIAGKYSTITDANFDEAKAQYGLVADKFDLKFGVPLSGALLQDPDVGIKGTKAEDVFLGVAPKNAGDVDYVAVNALKLCRNQVAAKMKMDKMNKNLTEFKINKLKEKARVEKLDASEEMELKTLGKQVEDLEHEIKTYDSEVSRLDNDIFTHEK